MPDNAGYVDAQDERLRLGRVLANLEAGAKLIRAGVAAGSPSGMLRQPLEPEVEHDGLWLTRRQVMDAINAASTVEQVMARLYVRMDPRCQGKLGDRPSYLSPDQWDACRCIRPRDHDGEHECEHTEGLSLGLDDA